MGLQWEDEFLTVNQIAEHLQLNQQTIRNWIAEGRLPAVRVGRRVRIRRVDFDRLLAGGATIVEATSEATTDADDSADLAQALGALEIAYREARRVLGRRTAARRADLATELQDLSDAVGNLLTRLTDA